MKTHVILFSSIDVNQPRIWIGIAETLSCMIARSALMDIIGKFDTNKILEIVPLGFFWKTEVLGVGIDSWWARIVIVFQPYWHWLDFVDYRGTHIEAIMGKDVAICQCHREIAIPDDLEVFWQELNADTSIM